MCTGDSSASQARRNDTSWHTYRPTALPAYRLFICCPHRRSHEELPPQEVHPLPVAGDGPSDVVQCHPLQHRSHGVVTREGLRDLVVDPIEPAADGTDILEVAHYRPMP